MPAHLRTGREKGGGGGGGGESDRFKQMVHPQMCS